MGIFGKPWEKLERMGGITVGINDEIKLFQGVTLRSLATNEVCCNFEEMDITVKIGADPLNECFLVRINDVLYEEL